MSLVTVAGWAAILYVLAKLLTYLSKYVRTPLEVKKLGEWALVTGATDGIGKGFCFELANRGLNIVLVSRTPSKLQDVATEIEEKYKVKTKIVAIDFTKDLDIQERIESETKDLVIGVLVNNVGMSYDYPEYFLQIEDGATKCKAMVDCNINSMLNVTRAVLPAMVARGKGAVINMSSFSAFSGPLLSVYLPARRLSSSGQRTWSWSTATRASLSCVPAPTMWCPTCPRSGRLTGAPPPPLSTASPSSASWAVSPSPLGSGPMISCTLPSV